MNNKILEYHNCFNDIYDRAENLLKQLSDLSYEVTLNSYNNHYLNIDGKYFHQKYYMPVITIKNKGDICFNIDGIAFEFYISKEELFEKVNLNELINKYSKELNIYEFENCTIDIYNYRDCSEDILRKADNSKDDKFGISIDCSNFRIEAIIKHFNIIYSLIFENKK